MLMDPGHTCMDFALAPVTLADAHARTQGCVSINESSMAFYGALTPNKYPTNKIQKSVATFFNIT